MMCALACQPCPAVPLGHLPVAGESDPPREMKNSDTAQAMPMPSAVEVARPSSSMTTRLLHTVLANFRVDQTVQHAAGCCRCDASVDCTGGGALKLESMTIKASACGNAEHTTAPDLTACCRPPLMPRRFHLPCCGAPESVKARLHIFGFQPRDCCRMLVSYNFEFRQQRTCWWHGR